MLWENYVLGERLKKIGYQQLNKTTFFWRTYEGQEIDWIEEGDGTIAATECKWKVENVKVPTAFATAYLEASFQVVNQQNYLSWIT